MPKSSRTQIIKDEQKIIKELRKNAKESIDVIAKNCGFSRQKVWRVMKRLENNNTIWGYTTVLDDEKLGLDRFLILVKRNSQPLPKKLIDIIAQNKLQTQMEELEITADCSYFLHGTFDWAFSVTAKSIVETKRFVDAFMREFGPYIADIQIITVILPLQHGGLRNPDAEKVYDYF